VQEKVWQRGGLLAPLSANELYLTLNMPILMLLVQERCGRPFRCVFIFSLCIQSSQWPLGVSQTSHHTVARTVSLSAC
jgi:hypothetical protein